MVSGLRDLDRFGAGGYLFGRSAAGPSETPDLFPSIECTRAVHPVSS
jgi:hypothetical protein